MRNESVIFDDATVLIVLDCNVKVCVHLYTCGVTGKQNCFATNLI